MSRTSLIRINGTKAYLILAFWVFLILFAGRFLIKDAVPYFSLQEDVFGRFWNAKWWLVGHVTGGFLALMIGPFQFWKSFRIRFTSVHRTLGKVYLVSILVASLCSTYLAWTTALAIHWTWSIALQSLAIAWFCTVLMAYRFVRLKRFQLHKEWMIRSYVVTFGFVLFRYMNGHPFFVELGNFIERGPTIGWLCWAIPLFFTEIIIQWNKK